MHMKILQFSIFAGATALLLACTKEPPPRTVTEFVENPILLEATMVRCAQDRSRSKYEVDCVNAREAANRLAVAEDEDRRKELEAQSERKRQALRRTQRAAAEARRRAAEARRLREEAEYLGQFNRPPGEQQLPQPVENETPGISGNQPGAVISPPDTEQPPANAPAATTDSPGQGVSDLDAVREELKRRQEEGR